MEIFERIKYLRKEVLHKTQEEFSSAIKISRSNLGSIEIGRINVTSRVISDICSEYGINENWLRTGEGGEDNIFIPEDMQYFQNIGKLGQEKNEFKKFYLNMMMGLPDEYWDYIYKEFKRFEEKSDKE